MSSQVVANIAQSQTDSVLVAGLTGKKIRVVSLVLKSGATATDVTFKTKPAGSSVAISPVFAMGANDDLVLPYNPNGWFETAAGGGLVVTTGTGATTGILVSYEQVY